MSLYDKASLVFSGKAAAGKDGRAYNIKPVEKLKVDEYIENGGFDTDLVWIKNTDAGQEATISGGKGRLVGDGSAFTNLQQNDVFEADKVYKVSLEAEIREGELKVQSNGYDGNIGLISESGKHSFYFTGISGSPNLVLGRRRPNVDFDIEVDNVSVREVEQKAVDFTMVRGSNLTATREAPSGLIEKGRENLILQSNAFTTTWSTSNSPNITSGQLGYDGSLNAWKIELTANFGQILQTSLSVPTISTLSIFVKAGTAGFVRLRIDADTNAIADFDLSDGSVAHTEGNIIATKADSLGNGWFRVQMTSTTASGSVVRIYPAVAANDLSGTSGFIYIQDSQLEVGLAATPYINTTDSYSKNTAGVLENEPRYDYSGVDAALLLEPERQNLITHSEYFGAWSDDGTATVTLNQTTSPEGLTNAALLDYGASPGGPDRVSTSAAIDASTVYSFSVFAKKKDASKIQLRNFHSGSDDSVVFNLDAETVTLSNADSGKIENYGNDWYRCTMVFTSDSGDTSADLRIGAPNSYSDSEEEIYIYGAQLEKGSYATSYIPTYGSVATREGDGSTSSSNPMIPGEAFDLTGSFAVFLHLGKTQKTGGSSSALLRLVTPGDIELGLYPNGSPGSIGLNLYLRNQGNYVFNTGANAGFEANESKVCVIYNASTNALAYYINGTVFGSETRELNFGNGSYGYIVGATAGSGTTDFSAEVKELIFFNKVVTPEEAVSLTTI